MGKETPRHVIVDGTLVRKRERELFAAASEQFVKLTLLDSAQRQGANGRQDSQLINVFDVWVASTIPSNLPVSVIPMTI